MTDDLGWVALGVKPDASGFSSSLSRSITPGMDAESRRIGARFSSGFKKSAVLAGAGIATALAGGVKLAFSSLGDAEESRKVAAQTAAVLKSTGGAARVTAKDVGALANRLGNMAGIDDELIQSGENVLLTFKNVRDEAGKGNDVFTQGTKAALDMSVALGNDLQGSVIQVGKALNDPVKGMTALGKAGVTFSDQQKAAIKKMVETGDTLGAQKTILRELTKEFQGSARAQATESGKLSKAFGDVKEEIGGELLPYMDDLKRFIRQEGIPAVHDFFGFMHDTGGPAIKDVAGFLKDAAGHGKDLIGFLKDLPDPAKYAGLVALIGGVGATKLRGGRGGALGATGSLLGLTKPVNVYVTNPGFGVSGPGVPGTRTPRAVNAIPLVATLALGGEAFKDSGVPQALSQRLFGTDERTFGKVLDGDQKAIDSFRAQLKATSKEWDGFSDNATFAFDMVDDAIASAMPLAKQYRHVIDGTPRQIKTWVGLSGYEKALQQIRTLQAGIDALGERGLDNGVPYVHGGSAGVTVNVGRVEAHDYNDFMGQMQRKGQNAALGGRP